MTHMRLWRDCRRPIRPDLPATLILACQDNARHKIARYKIARHKIAMNGQAMNGQAMNGQAM
ncbi:MAG: hypothetical protein KJ666_01055, partial [Bacteroidetes bacterium]|nr:hypothetical protein [Bacteroidota bacterium]